MSNDHEEDDLQQDINQEKSVLQELSVLFGEDIIEQARLLDVADLNLTDEMTAGIGEGIKELKKLKHDPAGQRQWVSRQEPGLQLLLCLWIMDMDLLDKIQARSWL